MPSVSASHILVDSEELCKNIKTLLQNGATFQNEAKLRSKCPSGKQNGGFLGTFEKGKMVPEFDNVAFNAELGKLLGPVKTEFGYHLIVIHERKD